jgi:hypothetical protein
MSKNFNIFMVKEKKNDKSPDYNVTVKVGEKYVNIGGCWLKDGKGGKYFSCKLSDGFKGPKGERFGFSIEQDGVIAKANSVITGDETKKVVEIDALDIPF